MKRFKTAAFLLPGVCGIILFYLFPYEKIIRYSLQKNPVSKEFAGLDNYAGLLSNEAFLTAAANTAWITVAGVLLLVPFSLWLACLFEKKTGSWLRTGLLSPMVVPAACVVMVWRVLFEQQGIVNQWIQMAGGEPVSWFQTEWGKLVVILMFLWKYAGYNMIVFMGALANVPRELVEVADVEGANSRTVFFRIKLRCISPTLFFVILISIMNSLKIFREVYLLTGDYPNEALYLLSHFLNNTLRRMDYQKMSAAAIYFSLGMIIIIAILFMLEARFGKDVEK